MKKFGDPTFDYHATLTKIWGLSTLQLANDRILPMYPQDYYDQIKQYIDDLSFTTTMDTTAHEQIADLSHGPFHKPLKKLRKRSRKFEHKREKLMRSLEPYTNRHDNQLPEDVLKHLIKGSKRLMYFERGLSVMKGSKAVNGLNMPFMHRIYYQAHLLFKYFQPFGMQCNPMTPILSNKRFLCHVPIPLMQHLFLSVIA
ncbi:hypothetical protein K492DRAFT_174444, partial [Lichtheimia hyalospora FSU 10163]